MASASVCQRALYPGREIRMYDKRVAAYPIDYAPNIYRDSRLHDMSGYHFNGGGDWGGARNVSAYHALLTYCVRNVTWAASAL